MFSLGNPLTPGTPAESQGPKTPVGPGTPTERPRGLETSIGPGTPTDSPMEVKAEDLVSGEIELVI